MNLLFSFVLVVLGVMLIVYNKKLGLLAYLGAYIPGMKIYEKLFGWKFLRDETYWMNRFGRIGSRVAIIFFGIMLIVIAYSNYVDPIFK